MRIKKVPKEQGTSLMVQFWSLGFEQLNSNFTVEQGDNFFIRIKFSQISRKGGMRRL